MPEDTLIDGNLEAVIPAWAELPESVKDAISALVPRSRMEMVRGVSD